MVEPQGALRLAFASGFTCMRIIEKMVGEVGTQFGKLVGMCIVEHAGIVGNGFVEGAEGVKAGETI